MLAGLADERSELARARRLGLAPATVRHLRSLLDEQTRNAWAIGDVLVAAFGPGSTSGVGDGSRRHLAVLADELAVGVSSLVQWRATASAWPAKERHSCAWSLHAMLRARPDRYIVLDAFLSDCGRHHLSPTCTRLEEALGETRASTTLAVEDRIERLARRLDHDHLLAVIARLQTLLIAEPAAA